MSQPIKSGSSNHTLKLKPIVLCVSAILGMTSMAHGEIINTNGAGVINQHNGPTIVNINKASDKGFLTIYTTNSMLIIRESF